VRLACVKHAASVRSEPGSNSQVHHANHNPKPVSLSQPTQNRSRATNKSPTKPQPKHQTINHVLNPRTSTNYHPHKGQYPRAHHPSANIPKTQPKPSIQIKTQPSPQGPPAPNPNTKPKPCTATTRIAPQPMPMPTTAPPQPNRHNHTATNTSTRQTAPRQPWPQERRQRIPSITQIHQVNEQSPESEKSVRTRRVR